MKKLTYTSPADQAMKTIDFEICSGSQYSSGELSLIGEATRLVMEAALNWPDQTSQAWANHARSSLEAPSILFGSELIKKANHARALLEEGILINDEKFVDMSISNGLKRPVKG